jgi:peptidoglycan/xylan/chitin deacetylase (PgdA/CDA1 family)
MNLKALVERGLVRSGAAAATRATVRGRALILAYHNILPDGERPVGEASLHLPRRAFADQLDALAEHCQVVPLAHALEPPPSVGERQGRPRVAITFDDAYLGAVQAGVDELRRRGLPGTIFVTPGMLGGRSFWWDALAGPAGTIPEAVRTHALEQCRGEDEAVRRWAGAAGLALAEPPAALRTASEEALLAAARGASVTLGVHTWSHPNLIRLSPTELVSELRRPLDWLRQRFAATLAWVAYPYGLWSPGVAAALGEAGLEAGLRVSGGWIPRRGVDRAAIPRSNVPAGLSLDGFRLRLAGIRAR